jgi:hypothetical protein
MPIARSFGPIRPAIIFVLAMAILSTALWKKGTSPELLEPRMRSTTLLALLDFAAIVMKRRRPRQRRLYSGLAISARAFGTRVALQWDYSTWIGLSIMAMICIALDLGRLLTSLKTPAG